jgi:Tol biopolymer transport system component
MISALPARPCRATVAVLMLLVFTASAATPRNRTDLKWQTLTTEHFQVHYHQGTENTARRTAAIAEEIYPAITGLYDFEPPTTHLIIRDTDDYANGAAYYYDDKIEIWATALEFELRGTHQWLRDVITHEFTHMVQLQAAARLSHRIPAVYLQQFGYEDERRQDVLIGYPNQLYSYPLPGTVTSAWFAEGVSQYQTRSVYNDWWDTHRDMLLRTHVLDGTLLTLDEMGGFGGTGLESEMVYNQGNSLVRHIAAEYGEEALGEIARGLRSLLLLDMDRAFKGATGKSGQELYDEWKADLEKQYGKLQAEIAPSAIEGQAVSDGGYLNLYPGWRPGTTTVYWASNSGQDYGSLTLVKLENAEAAAGDEKGEIAGVCAITTPFTVTADGATAYLSRRTDKNPHGSRVNDIYVLDLDSEEDERLTHQLRGKDPAISPDGTRIATIINGDGTNQLVILDQEGNLLRQLTQSPHGTQYNTPCWSPDGRSIVLCTFRGLSRDILLIDAESGEERMLAESPADERDPCFIPGEEAILYSSDRSGIFNIYRLDLTSEELTQVTHLRRSRT